MFSSTQSKEPHYLTGFTRYYTHNHSSLDVLINTEQGSTLLEWLYKVMHT